jgi:hypothetical protein
MLDTMAEFCGLVPSVSMNERSILIFLTGKRVQPVPRPNFRHLTISHVAPRGMQGRICRRTGVKAGPMFQVNARLTRYDQANATLRNEMSPKLSAPSATGLPPSRR